MPAPLWPVVWAVLSLAPESSFEPLGRPAGSWQSRDPDRAVVEPGVVARIGSSQLKHGTRIRSLAFSPNGGLLASVDLLGTMCVWETGTGRLVRRWDLPIRPRDPLRFTADGHRVECVFADDFVVSYDPRGGPARREWRTPGTDAGADRPGAGRSACGQHTATVESAASLLVHDHITGKEKRLASGNHFFSRVGAIRFAPDGRSLFVGDAEGGLLHLDRDSGVTLRRYGPFLFYPPDVMAVAPDGASLAVVARNRIHLLDVATGNDRFPQPDHFPQPPEIRVAEDGRTLVLSGNYTAPREEHWDWRPIHRQSRTAARLTGWQGGTPCTTRQAPGGRIRVSFGGNTQFNQFDTAIVRFSDHHDTPIWSVKKGLPGNGGYAFSADGSRVAIVEEEGLGVYEAATGREMVLLPYPGGLAGREWAGGLAFTPDGFALVTAHPSGLAYWPIGPGERHRELRLRTGESLEGRDSLLTLSPDGRLAVIATDRCDLVVVELLTMRERYRLPMRTRGPASSYAFLADGRHLAVANGDSTVTVHDLRAWPAPGPLTTAWSDLADADAARADGAMRALLTRPAETPQWLRAQFRSTTPGEERLTRLIGDLDAPRYAVRERAQAELVQFGHAARPAIIAAGRTRVSPESRQRLESILNGVRGPDRSPDGLRADRAVEVLEQLRTTEAIQVLKHWSGGVEGATLTESARRAIARLEPAR